MQSEMEEQKEGEPAKKKAKRSTWDETIENDGDVLEKDDRNGHYAVQILQKIGK